MPLEENFHVVPHLKALTESIDVLAVHGHGSALKIIYTKAHGEERDCLARRRVPGEAHAEEDGDRAAARPRPADHGRVPRGARREQQVL